MEEEEKKQGKEIGAHQLFELLKRCWWAVLTVMVATSLLFFGLWKVKHVDQYNATAILWVTKDNNVVTSTDISIALASVSDYAKLMETGQFFGRVEYSLNSDYHISKRQLSSAVRVDNEERSRIIYISVSSPNPQLSADIANAAADSACMMINQDLEKGQDMVRVFEKAEAPETISNPFPVQVLILTGMAAGILTYLLFLAFELLNDRISSPEDVAQYLGLSVLGEIPNISECYRRERQYFTNTGNRTNGG